MKSIFSAATRNVIDPAANPRFVKSAAGTWTATAPKSEYLDGEPQAMSLVLADPAKGGWKISTTDRSTLIVFLFGFPLRQAVPHPKLHQR